MKKETIKWIIQLVISILTAIATSLGASSCVKNMNVKHPNKPYVVIQDWR